MSSNQIITIHVSRPAEIILKCILVGRSVE